MVVFYEGWKIWKRIPNTYVRKPQNIAAIVLVYLAANVILTPLY
jgi:hypothetical protein